MKRLYSLITVMLIGIASLCTLTSCEDDAQEVAYTLEGSWTGYLDTYVEDRWGVSGEEYRVTFTFIRNNSNQSDYDGSTSGRGIEIGYNVNDRYRDYYRSTFSWYVEDCYGAFNNKPTIVITYDDDRWNPIYIYDYRINGNRFNGYMDDGTNRDISFDLYYDGGFDYNDWRGYSQRSVTRGGDSVNVIDNGKSVRSGIFADIEPK